MRHQRDDQRPSCPRLHAVSAVGLIADRGLPGGFAAAVRAPHGDGGGGAKLEQELDGGEVPAGPGGESALLLRAVTPPAPKVVGQVRLAGAPSIATLCFMQL